ncbi:MAG: hypothetical protein ABI870_00290 [Rhodanobacter sp.]
MTDHAYDITHLLESELAKIDAPELRIVRTPPPRPAAPVASAIAGVAAAQEALARELMLASDVHEALIQQYLRISSNGIGDAFGH